MKIEDQQNSKQDPKYAGPYRVLRRTKGGSYVIQDMTGTLFPSNVAANKLKIIDKSNEEERYEIEAILNDRTVDNNKKQYLIKFKNYNSEYNEWLPAENISTEAIHNYWKRKGMIRTSSSSSSNSNNKASTKRRKNTVKKSNTNLESSNFNRRYINRDVSQVISTRSGRKVQL